MSCSRYKQECSASLPSNVLSIFVEKETKLFVYFPKAVQAKLLTYRVQL
jgi:hypothetical protein